MENLKKICFTQENVNLKTMCSYKIGGVGKVVCYPKCEKELKRLIKFLHKTNKEYFILGNGTNVVFEDKGFNNIIICLKKMKTYKIKKRGILAGAGLNLFLLNKLCKENGFGGLEWSYGIPGTVGGAVCMNAGAYDGEIKNHIKYIWVLKNGRVKKLKNKDMKFEYRSSYLQSSQDIVIKVLFEFNKSAPEAIEEKQKHFLNKRKEVQPYGTNNAGSVFKKANGISAGKIIDKLGLKSVKIGDIEISSKHANFFINLGKGTSDDLHKLIDLVKKEVKEKENITLQEEIKFVGKREG